MPVQKVPVQNAQAGWLASDMAALAGISPPNNFTLALPLVLTIADGKWEVEWINSCSKNLKTDLQRLKLKLDGSQDFYFKFIKSSELQGIIHDICKLLLPVCPDDEIHHCESRRGVCRVGIRFSAILWPSQKPLIIYVQLAEWSQHWK